MRLRAFTDWIGNLLFGELRPVRVGYERLEDLLPNLAARSDFGLVLLAPESMTVEQRRSFARGLVRTHCLAVFCLGRYGPVLEDDIDEAVAGDQCAAGEESVIGTILTLSGRQDDEEAIVTAVKVIAGLIPEGADVVVAGQAVKERR